jgi:hypothetical protein
MLDYCAFLLLAGGNLGNRASAYEPSRGSHPFHIGILRDCIYTRQKQRLDFEILVCDENGGYGRVIKPINWQNAFILQNATVRGLSVVVR